VKLNCLLAKATPYFNFEMSVERGQEIVVHCGLYRKSCAESEKKWNSNPYLRVTTCIWPLSSYATDTPFFALLALEGAFRSSLWRRLNYVLMLRGSWRTRPCQHDDLVLKC
jgi:hypothetical protein